MSLLVPLKCYVMILDILRYHNWESHYQVNVVPRSCAYYKMGPFPSYEWGKKTRLIGVITPATHF